MRLIKFGNAWINPMHVIAAEKLDGLRVKIWCVDDISVEIKYRGEAEVDDALNEFVFAVENATTPL